MNIKLLLKVVGSVFLDQIFDKSLISNLETRINNRPGKRRGGLLN